MNDIEPIISWAGGKRWLQEIIKDFYAKSGQSVFIEPCGGGLACALHIKPEHAIINDINPQLINLYREIAKGLTIDFSNPDYSTANYYKLRTKLNELQYNQACEGKEAATLFYILMKLCFNGIPRYNLKGGFNTPIGDKNPQFLASFDVYKNLFSNWQFKCVDLTKLDIPSNSFMFVDTPYDGTHSSYWKVKFTRSDHERTIKWASELGIPVVLTNSPTDFILDLYKKYNFSFKIITANHTASGLAKGRGKTGEVIAWKNTPAPKSVNLLT